MDGLVMCGGRGTRLESPREKPLYPIEGVPMVDRVVRALERSAVETIYAAVSPNAPDTAARVEGVDGVCTIETPGDGYVADLGVALEAVGRPVLTVAADLPLLEAAVVDRVLTIHGESVAFNGEPAASNGESTASHRESAVSLAVAVPAALKRRLGASVDARLEPRHLVPTGANVVGEPDSAEQLIHVSYDTRLAINVNRAEDARLAERLRSAVESRGGGERRCG